MITVLQKSCWVHSRTNTSEGGLVCQVTKCQHQDIIFYVRENITGIDSFMISSNQRWGDKVGSKPSRNRQCLELHAPEEVWQGIADLVKAADTLKRPVYKNKSFNMIFIKKFFP